MQQKITSSIRNAGKYRKWFGILALLVFFTANKLHGQGPCDQISFSKEDYGPCEFGMSYTTQTDCYIELRFILTSGEFASYTVNSADGFMVQQISPSELWVTHEFGFIPTNFHIPLFFTLPHDLNTSMSVAYLNDCAQLGCEIIGGWPIESCPDPKDASIGGVKYRECGSLPYVDQPTIPGWTIQAFDADGNLAGEAVTDADGNYRMYDLPYGLYYVRELPAPGWTPKVPASGEYVVDLGVSEQATRNFGNCPGCSCDSVKLSLLPLNSNSLDTSCYKLKVENVDHYCFNNIEIQVNPEKTITTWSIVKPNWSVTPINSQHLQLFPPSNYLPDAEEQPLTFCVVGEPVHDISLSTTWTTSGNTIECKTRAAPHTQYGIIVGECNFSIGWNQNDGYYVDIGWEFDPYCRDAGPRVSQTSSSFHIETAVLKPVTFPAPTKVIFKDRLGYPVITAAGEVISLFFNDDVTAKIQSLSPAPVGYEWYGLQSNLLTPSNTGLPDSLDFTVLFFWKNLPEGSQNATGAFWISDDKDDLYGELIADGYATAGISVHQPNTKYGCTGPTCSFSKGFPDLVDVSWGASVFCDDYGDRVSTTASLFHIEAAILKPISFNAPASVTVLDSLGNSVTTGAGEVISLFANASVAAKLQSLSPAPPGYEWYGLQSNLLTPSNSGTLSSLKFNITLCWKNLPEGSENSTGILWVSDDKGEL